MDAADRVLVDSSAWIDYFAGDQAIKSREPYPSCREDRDPLASLRDLDDLPRLHSTR